ncbi:MAG: GspH/FimT family pseudopilin [Rhodospirillales bacterium]|nr:MAG: GspH/FimT family pseudopilin [Rhodospirillales bacterium]
MVASRGYTLLELLVAFAIVGLVLASVPMVVATARPGPAARVAAEELAAALRLARSEAIGRYAPATLLLDVERRVYRDADGVEHALAEDLDFSFVTARSELTGDKAGQIRFFPDGSATGGRVTVTDGGQAYIVNVDWLTGIVDVER